MQQATSTRHHVLELRHATTSTYIASYLFPVILLAYEIYRVSMWVADYGMNFRGYISMGYEFALMLAIFLLQVGSEVVFLLGAAFVRHHDFGHRIANLVTGILCSAIVLIFDFGLQVWL
jgi:hypothetical protein